MTLNPASSVSLKRLNSSEWFEAKDDKNAAVEVIDAMLRRAPSLFTMAGRASRRTGIPDEVLAFDRIRHSADQDAATSAQQERAAADAIQAMERRIRDMENQAEALRRAQIDAINNRTRAQRQLDDTNSSILHDRLRITYWTGHLQERRNGIQSMITAQNNLFNDITRQLYGQNGEPGLLGNISDAREHLERARQLEVQRQRAVQEARAAWEAFTSGDAAAKQRAEQAAARANDIRQQMSANLHGAHDSLNRRTFEVDWDRHEQQLRRAAEHWERAEKSYQAACGVIKCIQKALIIGIAAGITALTGGVAGVLMGIAAGAALSLVCNTVDLMATNRLTDFAAVKEALADVGWTTLECALTCVGANWAAHGLKGFTVMRAASLGTQTAQVASAATRLGRIALSARQYFHVGLKGIQAQSLCTTYHLIGDVNHAARDNAIRAREQQLGRSLTREEMEGIHYSLRVHLTLSDVQKILCCKAGELSITFFTAGLGARCAQARNAVREAMAPMVNISGNIFQRTITNVGLAARGTIDFFRGFGTLYGTMQGVGRLVGGMGRHYNLLRIHTFELIYNIAVAEATLRMQWLIKGDPKNDEEAMQMRSQAYCAAFTGMFIGAAFEKMSFARHMAMMSAERRANEHVGGQAANREVGRQVGIDGELMPAASTLVAGEHAPGSLGPQFTSLDGSVPVQDRVNQGQRRRLEQAHDTADRHQGGALTESSRPFTEQTESAARQLCQGRRQRDADQFVEQVTREQRRGTILLADTGAPEEGAAPSRPNAGPNFEERFDTNVRLLASDELCTHTNYINGRGMNSPGPMTYANSRVVRAAAWCGRVIDRVINATGIPKLWSAIKRIPLLGQVASGVERYFTFGFKDGLAVNAAFMLGTWSMDRLGGIGMATALVLAATAKCAQLGRFVVRKLGWNCPADAGQAFGSRETIARFISMGHEHGMFEGAAGLARLRLLETAYQTANLRFNECHYTGARNTMLASCAFALGAAFMIFGSPLTLVGALGTATLFAGVMSTNAPGRAILSDALRCFRYLATPGPRGIPINPLSWPGYLATGVGRVVQHLHMVPILGGSLNSIGNFLVGAGRLMSSPTRFGAGGDTWSTPAYFFTGNREHNLSMSMRNCFDAHIGFDRYKMFSVLESVLAERFTVPENQRDNAWRTFVDEHLEILTSHAVPKHERARILAANPEIAGYLRNSRPEGFRYWAARRRARRQEAELSDETRPENTRLTLYDVYRTFSTREIRAEISNLLASGNSVDRTQLRNCLIELANTDPKGFLRALKTIIREARDSARTAAPNSARQNDLNGLVGELAQLNTLHHRINAVIEGRVYRDRSAGPLNPAHQRWVNRNRQNGANRRGGGPLDEAGLHQMTEDLVHLLQTGGLSHNNPMNFPMEYRLVLLQHARQRLQNRIDTEVKRYVNNTLANPDAEFPRRWWWPFGAKAEVNRAANDAKRYRNFDADGNLETPGGAELAANLIRSNDPMTATLPLGGYGRIVFDVRRLSIQWNASARTVRNYAVEARARGTVTREDSVRHANALIRNNNNNGQGRGAWVTEEMRGLARTAGDATLPAETRTQARNDLISLIDRPRSQLAAAFEAIDRPRANAHARLTTLLTDYLERSNPGIRDLRNRLIAVDDAALQLTPNIPAVSGHPTWSWYTLGFGRGTYPPAGQALGTRGIPSHWDRPDTVTNRHRVHRRVFDVPGEVPALVALGLADRPAPRTWREWFTHNFTDSLATAWNIWRGVDPATGRSHHVPGAPELSHFGFVGLGRVVTGHHPVSGAPLQAPNGATARQLWENSITRLN